MDDGKSHVPLFVSFVALLLGCYDILRGIMHTLNLEYSALHITTLNLATPEAADLLRLLGAFGISNFITGVMLIFIAFKARGLALIMLFVIPLAYLIGILSVRVNVTEYVASKAAWGGMTPMIVYLSICFVTFLLGLVGTLYKKTNAHY